MISVRKRTWLVCAAGLSLCFLFSTSLLCSQIPVEAFIEQIEQDLLAGQTDSALALARRAADQYPDSAILIHFLAVAESQKGLNDEARKSFHRAIRLDPTIPQNYYDLAILDMRAENYGEAAAMLATFIGVNPRNGKAHLLLGMAYQKQGKLTPAIEEFKKAIALSPDLESAHYQLGMAYDDQGDKKAALAEFQKEIEISPHSYDAYWQAGGIALSLQDFGAAENIFRRGLELKPLAFAGHFGLAQVLEARNQLPQAASELETAVVLRPGDIDAHSTLARVYEKMGKPLDAQRENLVIETLRAQAEEKPANEGEK